VSAPSSGGGARPPAPAPAEAVLTRRVCSRHPDAQQPRGTWDPVTERFVYLFALERPNLEATIMQIYGASRQAAAPALNPPRRITHETTREELRKIFDEEHVRRERARSRAMTIADATRLTPEPWRSQPRFFLPEGSDHPVKNATTNEHVRTHWGSLGLVELPRSVCAFIALASDIDAVMRVEALALEAGRRGVVWGLPRPRAVVWQVAAEPFIIRYPDEVAPAPIDAALGLTEDELARRSDVEDEWSALARRHVLRNAAWHGAVEARAVVPKQAEPPLLRGQTFAALENPFEPIVEIWRAGYAFRGQTIIRRKDGESIGAVVLVAREPRIDISELGYA
jgi:hypothetical protein